MKIELTRDRGRNPIKNIFVLTMLERGHMATIHYGYIGFDVDQWLDVVHAVHHAMSVVSRDDRGVWLYESLPVRVTLDNGSVYHTNFKFDPKAGGVRYVSLYQ